MKVLQKRSVRCFLILLFALSAAGIIIYCTKPRSVVLEFGMFTGSNWNVANANSFAIIDYAIARFESEHPGVKVHYYSGVPKSELGMAFQKNSGRRGTGCIYGTRKRF